MTATRAAARIPGLLVAGLLAAACGGSAPCALCDAVAAKDLGRARQVLQDGAAVDRVSWELAVTSLANGETEGEALVGLLAASGADPNHRLSSPGSARRGAMNPSGARSAAGIIAGNTADPAVIEAMLQHGLDVKGAAGAEALTAAAAATHTAVVERLLAAGVPVNATAEGRTALSYAIETRHRPTIAALERAGALEW